MDKIELTNKILDNLSNSDEEQLRWDTLTVTDPDYLMHSPLPVGYHSTTEQRYLMQNLLIGFSGGSLLDIGCGRCDLYGVASELAALDALLELLFAKLELFAEWFAAVLALLDELLAKFEELDA